LVTIVSSIVENRTVDYQNNGDFRPTVVNNDFDRSVSLIKQISDEIGRRPQFQSSEQGVTALTLPSPIARKGLAWKDDLTGLENTTEDLGGITEAAQQSADDAAASAAEAFVSENNASSRKKHARVITKKTYCHWRNVRPIAAYGTQPSTHHGDP